jgi:hypothetical protein
LARSRKNANAGGEKAAEPYRHPLAMSPLRPEVETPADGFGNVLFRSGEHRQAAVKVLDDRGSQLLVGKSVPEEG